MIRVEGLVKRYGDVRAVDGASFAVERGEVVGFLGPNGAGKSTTLRCLAGALHPDGGRVEVAGREVHPDDPASRRAVGWLPETTPLHRRMRVRAYLDHVGRLRGLARGERRAALDRAVDACGLAGWEARRIAHLSKGYRQRVGLAQALLADPDVLLLDEPTSGLDPGEVGRLRELVRALGERRTVVLSTHVLSEVRETCPRVVILAAGRVVADGSPVDLATAEGAEVRLVVRGAADGLGDALAALPGVRAARPLGADAEGLAAFAVTADDRRDAAERAARLVHERGLGLVELSHELPSLERVFLRRVEEAGAR